MTFVYTWNSTFLSTPADTEAASLGAQRIRDTKAAVGERLAVDHSLAGDANDGKHTQVTLMAKSSSTPLSLGTGNGALFLAPDAVSGLNEGFFQNSGGNVIQLTRGGALLTGVLVGEIKLWPWNVLPPLYVWANGVPLSRTTYARLFALWGTTFGVGDGTTTFGIPNLQELVYAGLAGMGGAPDPGYITAASIGVPTALGSVGGSELQQNHAHSIYDPGHFHTATVGMEISNGNGYGSALNGCVDVPGTATNIAGTGITINAVGGGGAQNIQPTFFGNYIIYAGV